MIGSDAQRKTDSLDRNERQSQMFGSIVRSPEAALALPSRIYSDYGVVLGPEAYETDICVLLHPGVVRLLKATKTDLKLKQFNT